MFNLEGVRGILPQAEDEVLKQRGVEQSGPVEKIVILHRSDVDFATLPKKGRRWRSQLLSISPRSHPQTTTTTVLVQRFDDRKDHEHVDE